MATLFSDGVVHVKGAPEIVLGKCSHCLDASGGTRALTENERAELLSGFAFEQAKGRRTLAFGYSPNGLSALDSENLCYLGFVAISDPVRPDVADAVASCLGAGIKIKIVTGDTAVTASEIARSIGLDPSSVMEGREFEALDEAGTLSAAGKLSVIARARPNDKLKLVNALKSSGEVVAVTGDGTNDAPALHHADVGISMGRTGTAIAREASDIILLDDSFKSIVNAVLWGRSLYLNIQRFIVFQLTINLAAAIIAVGGPFIGVEMPFTVLQMLWINLIMDTFAALALATEPPTENVMKLSPRKPGSFIITRPMAEIIISTAVLFGVLFLSGMYFLEDGGLSKRESTLVFTVFVFAQLWNLFNARALGSNRSMLLDPPHNPLFVLIVCGTAVLQIVITQFAGGFFRCEALSFTDYVLIVCATSLIFWFGEVYRFIIRFRERRI